MGKKAWVKAVRETCGISQQDLADAVGVRVLTAKRWEREDGPEPPADVVAYLTEQLGRHDEYVGRLVDSAVRYMGPGDTLRMDVYRSQADADAAYAAGGEQPIPYRRWNAMQYDAANRLRQLGVSVVWCHPDEELPRPQREIQ